MSRETVKSKNTESFHAKKSSKSSSNKKQGHAGDIAYINQIVKILKDNNLSEITYETKFSEIKVVSQPYAPLAETIQPVMPQATVTPSVQDNNSVGTQQIISSQNQNLLQDSNNYDNHPGAIKSPMVGTCYLAPEPGAETFIKTGDTVAKDQPLLIIEAMKVMNYIKAPKEGKVIYIAVKDAQPVEYNQLLLVIE